MRCRSPAALRNVAPSSSTASSVHPPPSGCPGGASTTSPRRRRTAVRCGPSAVSVVAIPIKVRPGPPARRAPARGAERTPARAVGRGAVRSAATGNRKGFLALSMGRGAARRRPRSRAAPSPRPAGSGSDSNAGTGGAGDVRSAAICRVPVATVNQVTTSAPTAAIPTMRAGPLHPARGAGGAPPAGRRTAPSRGRGLCPRLTCPSYYAGGDRRPEAREAAAAPAVR